MGLGSSTYPRIHEWLDGGNCKFPNNDCVLAVLAIPAVMLQHIYIYISSSIDATNTPLLSITFHMFSSASDIRNLSVAVL